MYPVMSMLRRLAAHHVYVTPDMLEAVEGALHIRLETATSHVALATGVWAASTDLVPMHTLHVSGASSVEAAISATRWENKVAERTRAPEMLYTLVLGPEDETQIEDGVARLCRMAVVRGVYRASGKRLEIVPQKDRIKRQFSRTPAGIVRL